MATYAEMQAQIADLQEKAEQVRKEELSTAIAQINDLMKQYGITIDDLKGSAKNPKKSSSVAAQYRDPTTGKEWSGRGRPPTWITEKNKDDFRI